MTAQAIRNDAITPTAVTTDSVLEIRRRFKAPRQRVFDCFIKRDDIMAWFGPEGMTIPDCEFDPRVGGRYRTTMQDADGSQHIVTGEFREITPPSRIVQTWSWIGEDGTPGNISTVTLTFIDHGDETELHVRHENHTDADSVAQHVQGWESSLVCLAALVE